MHKNNSIHSLSRQRLFYRPSLPHELQNLFSICFEKKQEAAHPLDPRIKTLFPHLASLPLYRLVSSKNPPSHQPLKVGVVFSGGPAPGGHNVIAGLFDALKQIHSSSELMGFLNGPGGVLQNVFKPITQTLIDQFRNQGGFDLLGSGREKIETPEQFAAAAKTVLDHKLNALIIIGGDDSNTNAAMLAEYFLGKKMSTQVIGIPKTIDGDLQSPEIEISFGFDTACKTYAELIGNIAKDALSSKKYYHFIKLMGRSASHVTLECALLTQPNLAFISEEKKELRTIVNEMAALVMQREKAGKEYGVILIPEGLIESIKETDLPEKFRAQFIQKDAHGNIQVSQIETERLLINLVTEELKQKGYQGKFHGQPHFLGYEGRCAMPSNFDANYTYALGFTAALAVRDGLTGVIAAIRNLESSTEHWEPAFASIIHLLHFEMRSGKEQPVIRKTLVDLNGGPFLHFASQRKSWQIEDQYLQPGPIQFFGYKGLTDNGPLNLSKKKF